MPLESWATIIAGLLTVLLVGFFTWMFRIDRNVTRLIEKLDGMTNWIASVEGHTKQNREKLEEHSERITRVEARHAE